MTDNNPAKSIESAQVVRLQVLCETTDSGWQLRPVLPYRFASKIRYDRETHCWHWIGAKRTHTYKSTVYAYGQYSADGTPTGLILAHRFSYELHKGPIPKHLDCDHICQNKLCVNPEHLQLVSHQENCILRAARRAK